MKGINKIADARIKCSAASIANWTTWAVLEGRGPNV
jgi:hypothetical protein